MMLKSVNLITQNPSYKANVPLTPSGIVVHSTGVNQKKISAYRRQFNTPSIQASVHGALGLDDEGQLCYDQWLPYNIRCWGVGGGQAGSFNNSHLQFEICEYQGDEEWVKTTYQAALDICHWLCTKYGIDPDAVVSHKEAHDMGYGSNHGDPDHWWGQYGLSMDGFRKELKNQMFNTEENYKVFKEFMDRYEREKAALPEPLWSQDEGAWAKAEAKGVMDGTRPESPVKRVELAAIMDRSGLFDNLPDAEG